jgi:hypothetical protein
MELHMRIRLVASVLLLLATVPAAAQVSIGITIGSYPSFMAVPGYPVYYAPGVGANYFFYDGLYWVYQDDNWYSSSWYNGPWDAIDPMYVPIDVLQVPVRYYIRPPRYFTGWQPDRPPRWNDHWGRDWSQRRQDWDRPRHEMNSAPAPLPDYQRRYSGKDYPRADQQRALQQQNYRYHPQNTNAGRAPGRPSDERRPSPVQSNAPVQSQQKPQQKPRQTPQPRPQDQHVGPAPQQNRQPQVQRAPQPDQHQPVMPRPEQPRAPTAREPGHAGPGAASPNSPDAGRKQGQKPRNDQSRGADKKQENDHKRD